MSDLDDDERAAFGLIQESLPGLITPEDILTLSDTLPADTSAAIVLLEHPFPLSILSLFAAFSRVNYDTLIHELIRLQFTDDFKEGSFSIWVGLDEV